MNRIILIGNGFDIAHKMPTKYIDFIDNYYKEVSTKAIKVRNTYKDENLEIRTNIQTIAHIFGGHKINSFKELKDRIHSHNENYPTASAKIVFENKLLESITHEFGNQKRWVDIEEVYFRHLKEIKEQFDFEDYEVFAKILNDNLKSIEKYLESYLNELEQENTYDTAISQIKEKIYSRFKIKDFSLSSIKNIKVDIKNKIDIGYEEKRTNHIENIMCDYKKIYDNLFFDLDEISNFISSNSKLRINRDKQLSDIIEKDKTPDFFAVPENILFLNFNYTHTEKRYIIPSYLINVIHIHGEVNNKNNPMIFGYGDELGDDYQQLENANQNELLKNMKSVRYLETDNYRKLLDFIESDLYQIFIFGHSCGISDRTLLNTLFEHKNCTSIKPYYHKISDKEDNYSDIVRSISRNFTNKILMRDRVVNKTFCEPLIE